MQGPCERPHLSAGRRSMGEGRGGQGWEGGWTMVEEGGRLGEFERFNHWAVFLLMMKPQNLINIIN